MNEKHENPNESSRDMIRNFRLSLYEDEWNRAARKDYDPLRNIIGFRLGTDWYAISMEYVREVIKAPPVTPLPFIEEWFCGIMNVRGEMISVVDLRVLFRQTSRFDGNASILILEHDGLTSGFLIEDAVESLDVEQKCFEPVSTAYDPLRRRWMKQQAAVDQRIFLLLDAVRLLQETRHGPEDNSEKKSV